MMWTVVVLLAALACVQAQPTITPELIEANEGDNATFNCSEIISQSQFTVEIMRPGDTGFSTLPISDPRLSVEEVGTTAVYTYGPVERDEDGSLLQCNLGGVPSISATLRVYYPPEYVNPGMQSIVEGNDFVLDLNLTANPIPEDYQWQKDGVNITNGRFTLTVDQIVIDTALRGDAGGYTLTAMNIAGQGTISFELDVLFAPEPAPLGGTLAAQCVSGSPMTCNIVTANSGTLVCMAAGNPTPTIEVTSNAEDQSNIGFSGATIQITNAVPENTGLYTCNFTNSVDSVTQDFQLNIGVVPDLVNVTAVESADRNNVVVSWVLIEPSAHVLVITYRITFTSNSANTIEMNKTNTEEETNTEVTIAHSVLEEDTLYTVTVAGTNALGTSEPITTTYQFNGSVAAASISAFSVLLMLVVALAF